MYINKCCHYDNGFDPRFHFDGHFLETEDYPPIGIIGRIYKYAKELFDNVLEKLGLYKPSLFRKQLKATIKTEWQLSHDVQQRVASKLFWCKKDSHCHFYYDNLFFEQTGELFKTLVREKLCNPSNTTLPPNLFPAELLAVLYYSNAPQEEREHKKKLRPSDDHSDISRCTSLGFIRLGPHANHYAFIRDTDQAADALKQKTREWRQCLIEADIALEAGKPEEEIKAVVTERVNAFYMAWMNYVSAHEILSEVYEVLSEKNIFKEYRYADYCKAPEILDIITRCKQLWKRVNHLEEENKIHDAIQEAFLRRAEKGAIEGKVNQTALLFQQKKQRSNK